MQTEISAPGISSGLRNGSSSAIDKPLKAGWFHIWNSEQSAYHCVSNMVLISMQTCLLSSWSKKSAMWLPFRRSSGGNGPKISMVLARRSSSTVQVPLSDASPAKRTIPWTNSIIFNIFKQFRSGVWLKLPGMVLTRHPRLHISTAVPRGAPMVTSGARRAGEWICS